MSPHFEVFKAKTLVSRLSSEIAELCSAIGEIKVMHVCGTHEHEIVRYGIRQLLPPNLHIVPGPGCPVCVCPVEDIDQAITLAYQPQITILTFGDMMRVPSTRESLADAKRNGGQVKLIYSPFDAVALAKKNPTENYVFFSVGFETTAAGVAALIQRGVPENLYFLIANRYLPPVMELLMEVHDDSIQGFMLPGHASTITGLSAYDFMVTEHQLPCAVTGFEPADILAGLLALVRLIQKREARIVNAYPRAVKDQGNLKALQIMNDVFDRVPGIWRGIDRIDGTAFVLKEKYNHLNAQKQFNTKPVYPPRAHHPACQCHRVMLGEILPTQCKLYRNVCHPGAPYGPCMVSVDGTCRSWFTLGSPEENEFEHSE
ncbi:hydrogenase formation protein HypD [Deltaproteobacteria bacterium TL4]